MTTPMEENSHDQPRNRSQALEPLQRPARRRHHLPPIRHRAHLHPLPQDGEGNRHRGRHPRRLPLGRPQRPQRPRPQELLQRAPRPPRHRDHRPRARNLRRRRDQHHRAEEPRENHHEHRRARLVLRQGRGPRQSLRGPARKERQREEIRRRPVLHPAPAHRRHDAPHKAPGRRALQRAKMLGIDTI